MNTRETLQLLRDYESRNITFMEADGSWPIVWERASGVHVWDANGKKYLDLTAAFGVAATGHANPRVVKAGQEQMARLLHAMGDVHPHALKAQLARELSRITFERWQRKSRVESLKSITALVTARSMPPTARISERHSAASFASSGTLCRFRRQAGRWAWGGFKALPQCGTGETPVLLWSELSPGCSDFSSARGLGRSWSNQFKCEAA